MRKKVTARRARDVDLIGAIRTHDKEVGVPRASAMEHDVLPIR